MAKQRPCREWPNCECPKCDRFRHSLDVVFSWDKAGMGSLEAKDRPIQPPPGKGKNRPRWIRDLYGQPCHYCGKPGFTIDHKTPKCRGGKTTAANVVPACAGCNRQKGDMGYEQYLAFRKGEYPGKALC